MKKHWLKVAILAAIVVLLFWLLRGGKAKEVPLPAAPVSVSSVSEKNVKEVINTVGKVESFATVDIKSRVDGEILNVHFDEGASVKAGDLLFSLDPRPFKAKLDEANALKARDVASLNKAKEDLKRYSSLVASGAVSRDEYEKAATNAASLVATVNSDKALVESARLQLEYCSIKAPLSGKTGRIFVRPGNLVKANADTPLVTIEQMEPVRVLFVVSEVHFNKIKQEMGERKVIVTATPASKDADSGKKPPTEIGELSFVDNTINSDTGNIYLKGIFENKDETLWPGQFVEVNVDVGILKNALTVENKAIMQSQNGPYVYVINTEAGSGPDKTPVYKAEMRYVKPGYSTNKETVITNGLKKDETIVLEGQLRLTPGVLVKIVNNPSPPNP